MHDGRVSQGVSPFAAVGAVRLWDSGTSWRELETSPGVFSWSALDRAVETVEKGHARPLLVLGQTPSFYAAAPHQDAFYGPGAASMPDLRAWRRYVGAVAERYGARIDYQPWNEPNVVGFWSGSPRQMAELTLTAAQVIHRVAPRATVVAPPFVLRLASQRKYFRRFWTLQSGEVDLASSVDAVSLNLYPLAEEPPEAEVPLVQAAARKLDQSGVGLPVWNTEVNFGLEGGGPTPVPISADLQRAYVMRTYLLNAGLAVRRVYWYRWDLTTLANTLLVSPDLTTPTSAGRSLATLRGWLLGASVQPCTSTRGVWSCQADKGDRSVLFTWKQQGPPRRVRMPGGATSWTDADGKRTRCAGECRVPVGQTPVMVSFHP